MFYLSQRGEKLGHSLNFPLLPKFISSLMQLKERTRNCLLSCCWAISILVDLDFGPDMLFWHPAITLDSMQASTSICMHRLDTIRYLLRSSVTCCTTVVKNTILHVLVRVVVNNCRSHAISRPHLPISFLKTPCALQRYRSRVGSVIAWT